MSLRTTHNRTCAHAACSGVFDDFHQQPWPRAFCSSACWKASKPVKEQKRTASLARVAAPKKRKAISPASTGQRLAVQGRACLVCGTEITRYSKPSEPPKYCSQARSSKAQRKRVPRVCVGCGKPFEAEPSQVRLRGAKYCSSACYHKHKPPSSQSPRAIAKIAAAKRGSRNPQFKTGLNPETVKRAGISLDGKGERICRNCGSHRYPQLHHAIPRSMWQAGIRELLNCIPLCTACHMGWHNRRVTIYRDVFTDEEWAFISSADLLGQNVTAWLDARYPPRDGLSDAA